ncbi:MAG: ThiF family adenylyltransferase [Actinomycetota bacterium]|nr:ThiF family adenylyltransferase [Actinomycetota bacterium]
MTTERFARHLPLFGEEGQKKLGASRVAVVGVGGLGTHVVQQLGLLGVGHLSLVDPQELATTDRNRTVTARHDDPIPGSRKVDLAERALNRFDPNIKVEKIPKSLMTEEAFAAVMAADYVFGCLDSEGLRLVLNELAAAYARPYFDLASDVLPGDRPAYGGRVCVAWSGDGCLVCRGLLDLGEAQLDLSSPEARRDRDALYGVKRGDLGRSGPSVVSINGAVASLGVTEFMVAVTGLRPPKPALNWYAHLGRLTTPTDPPSADCYYCKGIRGRGDAADVQRYIRDGVGTWLT